MIGGASDRSVWTVVGLVAVVVSGVVSVAIVRELAIGERENAAADVDARRGDWPGAIAHARSAAEALVPGSPWPSRAFRRLESIGHDAEVRGDAPTALLAYGSMRAALEACSPWSSQADWRERADSGLARLAGVAGEGR